ncbi:MAG: class I SAM-dependent methyltransferase [Ignavibacteriae bacterium]|nr:class I SAM-dependent methyltransferase [Ignavibacteriota bacterium]MCB9244719.1 class I SAM-dependent methyltransferase [Ignavibacteriales bacterium]
MHEYSKTISRFYDSVYDKMRTPVDREFYIDEIVKAGGPVLEVGVGTGRIFVEALNRGADIYGIDISENMLEILREKLPESEQHRVSLADMRDFDLSKKFKLIIVPFRIFQHLLTPDEQVSALQSIKKHLDTDGKLIFDVFVPNLKRITEVVENKLELSAEYAPGKIVERYLDSVPDNINQIINITFTFKWNENGEEMTEKDSFPFRYYFRYELENLIARSGLNLMKIYGDFNYGELNNSSTEFVVLCNN